MPTTHILHPRGAYVTAKLIRPEEKSGLLLPDKREANSTTTEYFEVIEAGADAQAIGFEAGKLVFIHPDQCCLVKSLSIYFFMAHNAIGFIELKEEIEAPSEPSLN